MAYADYTFYTDVYMGNVIPSADFNRVSQRASDIIDVFTSNRITATVIADTDTYTKIKKANCALAEQIYYDEQSAAVGGGGSSNANIKSIKAGEETITYNSQSSTAKTAFDIQKDKYQTALSVISIYLYGTDLLYMGID